MKIYSYETLDSTNEFMKNNVSKFEEYDVVTAENQTLVRQDGEIHGFHKREWLFLRFL